MSLYKEQLDKDTYLPIRKNRKWRRWAKNQYNRFMRRSCRINEPAIEKRKYEGWNI